MHTFSQQELSQLGQGLDRLALLFEGRVMAELRKRIYIEALCQYDHATAPKLCAALAALLLTRETMPYPVHVSEAMELAPYSNPLESHTMATSNESPSQAIERIEAGLRIGEAQ